MPLTGFRVAFTGEQSERHQRGEESSTNDSQQQHCRRTAPSSKDPKAAAKAEKNEELCPCLWERMGNLRARTVYDPFVAF